MKNKGFTIIEMIAVLALLAILLAFMLPVIFNSNTKYEKNADKKIENLLYLAASSYIESNLDVIREINNPDFLECDKELLIEVNTLIDNGYINKPITYSNGEEIDYTKAIRVTKNADDTLSFTYPHDTSVVISSFDIKDIIESYSSDSTYVLLNNGDVYFTGNNVSYKGGIGDVSGIVNKFTKVDISNVKKIVSSINHTIYLTNDGDVYASGKGINNQLGSSFTGTYKTPVKIYSEVTDIAVNAESTLVLKTNGDLYATGNNYCSTCSFKTYQFGIGKTDNLNDFTFIASSVSSVVASYENVYYIDYTGNLYGAGLNTHKVISNSNDYIDTFALIDKDVLKMTASNNSVTYYTRSMNFVTIGDSYKGAANNLDTISNSKTNIPLSNIKEVKSMYDTTMVLTEDSKLYITGNGSNKLEQVYSNVKDFAPGFDSYTILLNDGSIIHSNYSQSNTKNYCLK